MIALVTAAMASSGCLVLSLQPAYDAQSVVFDETLLGIWVNAEDQTQATIERGEWRSYKVAYKDRFATRVLQGNLTSIGSATFLDLTEPRGTDAGPFLIPAHAIVRIELKGDTLSASLLDYGWLSRAMDQKTTGRVAAAFDDRRNAIIASPTAELRAWLGRVPEEAVSAPMTFRRSRSPAGGGDQRKP